MITAQKILVALERNLEKIRDEPELDWLRFRSELVPPLQAFAVVTDRDALEVAADSVWQVCLRYAFVENLIREYSIQCEKRPPPGGAGHEDEMPVRGIVNRFQSLLDKLKEMERLEEVKDQRIEYTR
jgi:hypothetical protein